MPARQRSPSPFVKSTSGSDSAPPAGGRLVLTVRDSGKGLAPDLSLGFGLTGMRERVHALGGDWSLVDSGSAGAAICVTFPLNAPHDESSCNEDGAAAK